MHTRANRLNDPPGQPHLSSRTFEELFGASFEAVFEALFGASFEAVLLEPALERDRAWFRAHPNHGRLLRRVTSWELPQGLRRRNIVWVEVLRSRDRFDRNFIDHVDDSSASDFDVIEEGVVPDAALEHAHTLLRCGAEVVEQTEATAADWEEFPGTAAIQYERVALPAELDQARSFLGFQPQKGLVSVTLHSPTIRSRELLLETFK